MTSGTRPESNAKRTRAVGAHHSRRARRIAPWALLLLALGCGNSTNGDVAVGITQRTFETRSATSGAPRALVTTLWYPAVAHTGTPEGALLRDAEVRAQLSPLLVYTHGTCSRPDEATYLTTALARAGFVVAAPSNPGYTEADYPACLSVTAGVEALTNAVPDITLVIDSLLAEAATPGSAFAQRVDGARIGVAGASFGGFSALRAAQQEPRVQAALALVPANSAFLGPMPIGVATMVIGAEHDQIAGFDQAQLAYDQLRGPRVLLELLDANHLSAIDSCISPAFGDSCVATDIPQDEAHRLILAYAVPFLDRFVTGSESDGLPTEMAGVVQTQAGL